MATLSPITKNDVSDTYLAQESALTDLILLEDGGYIVVNYGLQNVSKTSATLSPITKN